MLTRKRLYHLSDRVGSRTFGQANRANIAPARRIDREQRGIVHFPIAKLGSATTYLQTVKTRGMTRATTCERLLKALLRDKMHQSDSPFRVRHQLYLLCSIGDSSFANIAMQHNSSRMHDKP